MNQRVAAICMVFAACGGGHGSGETAVERKLRAAIASVLGAPVARVKCATAAKCVAIVDGVELPVTVKDDGAHLAWDIAGLVLRAPALEAKVAAMLGELGVLATIGCGPRVQVVAPGARLACTIARATRDGAAVADTGMAWATIHADGTADVELALGAEAVAARTTDVATPDLDALSRALDVDGDDEDGESPSDAAP